ncbi:MAG: beta-ketoacyl synthase N-terminal-like domain-containing protein [Gammaproteobacteria bacterium]|jgi:3-oxoacyl-[acyl-carrier-protein] synthase II
MMHSLHKVCITGYGLLSTLPEDMDMLWQSLNQLSDKPATKASHPLCNYDVEQQILKPSDRRLMGKTMQSAVYTAGVALDRAELKNKPALLQDTQIIVALRGGERDEAADQAIIAACDAVNEYEETLNKALMEELRPTLFLSQLPNLLAANIALLYGLTGSSVTLMGGEIGGAQAIQLAFSRIQSGQAERVLVGGVSNNESNEIRAIYACQPTSDDFCLGSASGFLILESEQSANTRQAPIFAKLSQCKISSRIEKDLPKITNILAMSNKSKTLLSDNADVICDANGRLGTILEAAMPVGIILALQYLKHKELQQLFVHCAGATHGHAFACVEVA